MAKITGYTVFYTDTKINSVHCCTVLKFTNDYTFLKMNFTRHIYAP